MNIYSLWLADIMARRVSLLQKGSLSAFSDYSQKTSPFGYDRKATLVPKRPTTGWFFSVTVITAAGSSISNRNIQC